MSTNPTSPVARNKQMYEECSLLSANNASFTLTYNGIGEKNKYYKISDLEKAIDQAVNTCHALHNTLIQVDVVAGVATVGRKKSPVDSFAKVTFSAKPRPTSFMGAQTTVTSPLTSHQIQSLSAWLKQSGLITEEVHNDICQQMGAGKSSSSRSI